MTDEAAPNRLTRITTRAGDGGRTRLANGTDLAKDDAQIEALGDLDELNACCGLLRAALPPDHPLRSAIEDVQQRLFDLGGQLAMGRSVVLGAEAVARLDAGSAALNDALPPLTSFVVPGANEAEARAHLCRTVARRAERRVVALAARGEVDADALRYLNRLSDYFFNVARSLGRTGDAPETLWAPHRRTDEPS